MPRGSGLELIMTSIIEGPQLQTTHALQSFGAVEPVLWSILDAVDSAVEGYLSA